MDEDRKVEYNGIVVKLACNQSGDIFEVLVVASLNASQKTY